MIDVVIGLVGMIATGLLLHVIIRLRTENPHKPTPPTTQTHTPPQEPNTPESDTP